MAMESSKLKLHLGCGEEYLEGYVNIDYPASEHTVMAVKADVYADIRDLEYKANSVDEIRSHHLFEHFTRADAMTILAKWRRWLVPGGTLVIETPDFEASARGYLNALTRKRKMELGRHIFGSHEAGWAFHYDFWDKDKFEYVLKKFGFRDIRARRYRNSLAKHFAQIPFLNFIGSILPRALYRKYGGNKLPDIVVTAKKDGGVEVDDEVVIREILSMYLTEHDDYKMLKAWLTNLKSDEEKRKET